jgi:signal transduction histidine kinase
MSDPGANRATKHAADHAADASARRAIAWLHRGAWIVGLAIAVGTPALHAVFGLQSAKELIEQEAEFITHRLSEHASAVPELWLYHTDAIQGVFKDALAVDRTISAARLVDAHGNVVLTVGQWAPQWSRIERQADVFDAGVAVANVQLQQTYRDLAAGVARTALLALLLALATWYLVARVAIGAVERSVERLQAARREAERATAARAVFLATMSHEIRTPMNGVIGMTSLLRDTELSESQRRYIEVIRGSGETLLRVINDILEFSKVESGKTELEPHRFQPGALGAEVLELLETLARHKDLKLAVEAAPGLPPWVVADVNRLRQILVNLVGNAIKFSDMGTIRLRVDCPRPGRLSYEVSDQGVGMSAEQLGTVFEPFVQADASISRRYGGTGLGLAISRRLAELMSGTIQARSERGQGTTMLLEVSAVAVPAPASDGAASGALPGELPGVPSLASLRVLVAEDNPVNAMVISAMLERLDVACELVGNGIEAVEAVLRQNYDVVLMDMLMPEMDGLEATRRVRASALPRQPRIVALTANAMLEDRELCTRAGMDAFLSKPLQLGDLERCLTAQAQWGGLGR